jgi:hypothetical protein
MQFPPTRVHQRRGPGLTAFVLAGVVGTFAIVVAVNGTGSSPTEPLGRVGVDAAAPAASPIGVMPTAAPARSAELAVRVRGGAAADVVVLRIHGWVPRGFNYFVAEAVVGERRLARAALEVAADGSFEAVELRVLDAEAGQALRVVLLGYNQVQLWPVPLAALELGTSFALPFRQATRSAVPR